MIFNSCLSNNTKRIKLNYYDVDFKEDKFKDIINEYKKNPMVSLLELSKRTKLSYPTLRLKIKELYFSKILLGKRARINYSLLDLESHLIMLKVSPNVFNKLNSFCEMNVSVSRISNTLGEYNCLIEVINKGQQDFEFFIEQLKDTLKIDLIDYIILNKIKEI